jgi:hypothetical protein
VAAVVDLTSPSRAVDAFPTGGFLEVVGRRTAGGGGVNLVPITDDGTPVGSTPIPLADRRSDVLRVAIATDAAGRSAVVWSETTKGGRGTIKIRMIGTEGQPTSRSITVATVRVADLAEPTVAIASDGRALVAWAGDGPGDSQGVFARLFGPSGQPAGQAIRINPTTRGPQVHPSLAARLDGGFVAAWSGTGNGDAEGVFARRIGGNGHPRGAATTINIARSGPQRLPALSLGADGQGIATWDGRGPGAAPGLYTRVITASASTSGAEVRVASVALADVSSPAISATADGRRAIAFAIKRVSGWDVVVQPLDGSGLPVGLPVVANPSPLIAQVTPSLALNARGDALVEWSGFGTAAGTRLILGLFRAQPTFPGGSTGTGGTMPGGPVEGAPVLTASLANDTGSSDHDGLTSDPTVRGSVQGVGPISSLLAGLDGGPADPTVNVTNLLGASGGFVLDRATLDRLAGGRLVDGPHSLQIEAVDAKGRRSAVFDLAFQLDTNSPAVGTPAVIAGDDTGASSSDGVTSRTSPSITIAAEAGALIRLTVDGQPVGQAVASAGAALIAVGPLADGTHTVVATAVDAAGNSATSAPLTLTIDTVSPALPEFDLASTSDSGVVGDDQTSAASIAIVGHAEAGVTLTLVATGATTVAGADGSFHFSDIALDLGANLLQVRATDLAGNASEASRTITRTTSDAQADSVLTWDRQAVAAVKVDGTAPPAAARAMAMASLAVFDSLNAIDGSPAYLVSMSAPAGASVDAAVAGAAHRVLGYLYPAQAATLDAALANSLSAIHDGPAKTDGLALGQAVADRVIALRSTDGWNAFAQPNTGSDVPGEWRPTAPNFEPALLPQYASLRPFAMTSPDQFLPDPPPALDSPEYAAGVNEIEALGRQTGSTRTADQTQIARFWADGTGTDSPPGHWNQIADNVAQSEGGSPADNARRLAELNVALADAGISAWNTKYTYRLWRPISAITLANTDGNDLTTADPTWQPLLLTPAFPEYASGHSTFSGAAATVLDGIFGSNVSFSIDSSGLPGVTRSFANFDAAAAEAGRSRVYGGIHFEFSNQAGQAVGREVGQFVLSSFATDAGTDTTPPRVSIASPVDGAVASGQVTVTGQVLDAASGVAKLEAQVDNGPFQEVAFDAKGNFSLPVTFSTDGPHVVQFQATDVAGNVSPLVPLAITSDSTAPTLTLDAPAQGADLASTSVVSGTVNGTGSTVVALSYRLDDGPSVPMTFSDAGSYSTAIDLSLTPVGSHQLTVTTRDGSGRETTITRAVRLDASVPFKVASITPLDGSVDVGTTFRPKVTFTRPVDPATLAAGFTATDPSSATLAARIVPSADGLSAWMFFATPLPGGSRITLHLDGSAIKSAGDEVALDADGDGQPGGSLAPSFTTVIRTPLAGTTIVGKVVDPGPDLHPMTFDDIRAGADGVLFTADDVFLHPLAGVKVTILGLEDQSVFTDANGNFRIDASPPGDVKLSLDGRTATNAPDGVFFPEMVMDLTLAAGVVNTVMGSMGRPEEQVANRARTEVYLPRVQQSILRDIPAAATAPVRVPVDANAAANLSPEQQSELYVDVTPGSMIDLQGRPMAVGQVGINTVPPEIVRDMLPPGLIEHTFDITVQAPGVSVFTTPAAMSFPNVFNAAPGTKLDFLSFDHTTGRLVIEGTATVTADGKSVHTDPGSGITHPGWHGLTPPGGSGGAGGGPPPAPAARIRADASHTTIHEPVDLPLISTSTGGVLSDSNLSWSTPSQGTLTVNIKIDGPLSSFMKPSANVSFLANQTLTFSKINQPPQSLLGIAKPYDALVKGGFGAIEGDRLYGSKISVTETHVVPGQPTTADVRTYYLYRWVDATNAPDAAAQAGNIAAFPKTLADGSGGFSTTKTFKAFLPDGVTTRFVSELADPAFNVPATPVHGNTSVKWSFDPTTDGNDFERLSIQVNAQDEVGVVNLKGTAVSPTRVSVNLDGYGIELKRAILSLRAGPNGPGGQPSVFYDFPLPATGSITVSAQFKKEWGDFMPSKRLGPGGTFSPAQLAALDTRILAAEQDLLTAVRTDFLPVNQAVIVQPSNTGADVMMSWNDLGPNLGGRTTHYDYDLDKLRLYVGTKGRTDPITHTTFTSSIPASAQQWALAEYIDLDKADTGEFAVGISMNFTNPNVTFAQIIANTVSHELAHTLGMNEGYLPGDVLVTGGTAKVRSDGNAPPFDEIMNNLQTTDGYKHFKGGRLDILKMAVGLWPSGADPTKALNTWRDQFNLNTGRPNVGGHGETSQAPLTTPEIALSLGDTDYVGTGGESLDLGTVASDGPGGDSAITVLHLTNQGVAPLTIASIRLADPTVGFSIDASKIAGMMLDPGTSIDLPVTFDPSKPISSKTQLLIQSNAGYAPNFSLDLTGLGYSAQPLVQLTSDAGTNLGGADLGGDPAVTTQVATITNLGKQPLTIRGITLPEGQGAFSLLGVPGDLATNPKVLALGESFTFGARFDADKPGLSRALVAVATNDPTQPTLRFYLSATGVDPTVSAGLAGDSIAIDTPNITNSATVHTRADANGNFSVFLPAGAYYELTAFDPKTGQVGHSSGITNASGAPTDLVDNMVFLASTMPDADHDGLPDDVEHAIGTSPLIADTDGNGVDDFTSIRQGLDPLGGRPLSTGILAQVPLRGEANAVAVEGSTPARAGNLAFVATGSYGLAVVDITRTDRPTLLSEIDLPGNATALAIDASTGLVVVATGSTGLAVVDVSNPASPVVLRMIPVDSANVQATGGVAFIGTGSSVQSYDLNQGLLLDRLDLPLPITGLGREGSFLYAIGSGTRLFTIATDGPILTLRGQVQLPSGQYDGAFFVGGGVAYLPNRLDDLTPSSGGLATVDVSDPDIPSVLSGPDQPDTGTTREPGSGIATNGSGLGLLVGSPPVGGIDTRQPRIDLLDLTDLSKTYQPVGSILLPAAPSSVVVAAGQGLVADGSGGLVVVNYLPTDTAGVAPTVSVLPGLADDPSSTSRAVPQGRPVRLRLNIADDVQVRSVEILLDDDGIGPDPETVAATSLSFPFEVEVAAPKLLPGDFGSRAFQIRVRVTDTGGNVTTTGPIDLASIQDLVPPVHYRRGLVDGASFAAGLAALPLYFSEPLARGSVTPQTFRVLDTSGQPVPGLAVAIGGADRVVTLGFAALPVGSYTLVLDSAHITDVAGNMLGSTPEVTHFQVVQATSNSYVGPQHGGVWNDPRNWSAGRVPQPSDDVTVDLVSDGTLTVPDASLRSIKLGGGTLRIEGTLVLSASSTFTNVDLVGKIDGAADVTVTGKFQLIGGNLSGTGPLTMPTGSTLVLAAGFIDGRPINIAGMAMGTGLVYYQRAPIITVASTGTFTASDGFQLLDQTGEVGRLDLFGRLETAPGASLVIGPEFVLEVGSTFAPSSGRIEFRGGGQFPAGLVTASDTILALRGPTDVTAPAPVYLFPQGPTHRLDGPLLIGGARVVMAGDVQVSYLDFQDDNYVETSTARQGSLVVDGTLSITQRLGRSVSEVGLPQGDVTGQGQVSGKGLIVIQPQAQYFAFEDVFRGVTIRNQGDLHLASSFGLGAGAVFEQEGTISGNDSGDGNIEYGEVTVGSNPATLDSPLDVGTFNARVPMVIKGSIGFSAHAHFFAGLDIQSPSGNSRIASFSGGATIEGGFHVGPNVEVDFFYGANYQQDPRDLANVYTIAAGPKAVVEGFLQVGHASLRLETDLSVASFRYLSSGISSLNYPDPTSVSGPGNIDVTGMFDWEGGRISGPGTLTLEAGATGIIQTNPAAEAVGLDGSTLINRGSLSIFYLTMRGGATIQNEGTLFLPQGSTGISQGTGGGTIRNAGTFRLDAVNGYGSGRTIAVPLVNLAGALIRVEPQGGLANNIPNTFASIDNAGTLSIGPNGDDDGVHRYVVVQGDYIQQASGTLHIEYSQLATFSQFPSGTLAVDGTAHVDGTLEVHFVPGSLAADASPKVGQAFTLLAFAARSGDFARFINLDEASGILLDRADDANRLRIVVRSAP